jgi:hypothetical protein
MTKGALLSERERLPTRTLVFVLTPERYQEQHGTFRLEVESEPTQQVWFREICLWREQPEPWWETVPGLMAMYPLCDHKRSPEEAIKYATQAIAAQVSDTTKRADLLASLAIFGRLVYRDLDVVNLIGVEQMRESTLLQEIEDAAGKKADIKRARIAVQQALDTRFGQEAAAEFAAALNDIQDVDRLSELLPLAIKSRGVKGFRRALARRKSPATT